MENASKQENNGNNLELNKKDMKENFNIKRSVSSNSSSFTDSSEDISSSEESRKSNKHMSYKSRYRSSSRSRSYSRNKRYSHKRKDERSNRNLRNYSDENSFYNKKRRRNDKDKKENKREKADNYDSEIIRNKDRKNYKSDYDAKSRYAGKEEEKNKKDSKPPIVKEKPNFNATGILATETNTLNGVVLKFTEPLDSAEPNEEWRLYCFKESETQDVIPIDQQSFYLVGKDERICNILVLHPSCSRQHAVIQFRRVEGEINTNGTFIDKEKLEPARYYELRNNDLINFGLSTRDYVLMKGETNETNKFWK